MELRHVTLLFFIFSICNIESYVLKKKSIFKSSCNLAPRSKGKQLRLKINDIINFKNKEELKREIIRHSKSISLDLNDKQINNIGNNLHEFFSYVKLKDIRIGVQKIRNKRNTKALPLCIKDNKYEEFHTLNMKKEGEYFVQDSNSYSS
ncbi:hypothetical protein, conserved [Plasmodium gonderi]|uniref:Variable surface protein n=1 Tax=Plasmodium gonderi TaxID=77519 RepID=A0A1Y1J9N8_PLAGO|nr:hypothetical protein, conserved [Plasmodium gonderi]GAW79211.1 hypothetical protein, conserved [Plasmodium gonderi]